MACVIQWNVRDLRANYSGLLILMPTGADWGLFKDLCCSELRLTAVEGWNKVISLHQR
jgi:hypothetical protein